MSNNIQADVNVVIQNLSAKITRLTTDNAVLNALVTQYQQELKKLEDRIVETDNAE